jgi:hypothetical protein
LALLSGTFRTVLVPASRAGMRRRKRRRRKRKMKRKRRNWQR